MNDELIRRIDVLGLLYDFYSDFEEYSHLFDDIAFMKPVNAVELPCKIGDIVYILQNNDIPINVGRIQSITITGVEINFVVFALYTGDFLKFGASQIGKLVYLSRKDAEEALKERCVENDKE